MIRATGDSSAEQTADSLPPSEVRPAATVMLVRDAPTGLEVFVLRRVAQMDFAAGMTVFPGGAVDSADHRPTDWLGPEPSWWAEQLGVNADDARALVIAAVRELFEETGVLLAERALDADRHQSPVLVDSDRLAILDRRLDLSSALAAAGARVRADLLRPWANWITPPGRTRRYDTFFFAAALPPGQQAQMLTTEADLGQWRTPQQLLDERDAGATRLMPPTVAMLLDLAGLHSVEAVLASPRVITPVRIRDLADIPAELREKKTR